MIEDSKASEKDDLIREFHDFQNSMIDVDTVLETNKALHEKVGLLKSIDGTDYLNCQKSLCFNCISKYSDFFVNFVDNNSEK